MVRPNTQRTLCSVTAMVLAAVLLLTLPHPSSPQPQPSSAELTRVVGRVEVLRKGQAQWIPGVIGAHLVEGDDIRAFSGASAELTLPDTSTVVLAENSRLLLSKLEFDQQRQSRTVLVHLAVGKVRAIIAQAAVALVRARQSNFAISTPTAVAAARGTILWVFTDTQGTMVAVEAQAGSLLPSRVDCIPLRGVQASGPQKGQTIFAGSMATDCGTPVPIQTQFLTFSNPATAGTAAVLAAPVVSPPPITTVINAITASITPESPPTVATSFNTTGGLGPLAVTPPSSFGQDIVTSQPPPQTPQPLSPQ